jgi:hypothetical protein
MCLCFAFEKVGAVSPLILFYLTYQLAFVHLLQGLHYLLPLCNLFKSVLVIGMLLLRVVQVDVESSEHVLASDVADYHFKGQTFGVGIFLKYTIL